MSVADVKALPWWEYELLLEGMRTELAPRDDDSSPGGYQPMGLDQLGITPQRVT
jgi:hypothetical protein